MDYSLFDANDNIHFEYFPKNHDLINPFKADKEIQKLIHVSKGYYTITADGDDYLFQDFRYGRATSWLPNQAENAFTFEYRIQKSSLSNKPTNLTISREQGERKLDKAIFIKLWQRILGKLN